MKVVNECRVDYKYRLSLKSPIINKTIFSNIASTQIIKESLKLSKSVNKKSTYTFDILIYTITIKNISDSIIKNIFFKDDIPKSTRFIENSVKINNIKLRCLNPNEGFYIEKLDAKDSIELSFKVLVVPINYYNIIENFSIIEYDYIYNVEEAPYLVKKESNIVKTKYAKKIFKQMTFGDYFKTSYSIDKIIDYKYNIDIMDTKIIRNPKPNLYTLLIVGKIEFKVWYKYNCCKKCNSEVFGFSTCMSVPVGIILGNKDDIKYDMQYLSIDLVNSNTIFLNMSLLLYY
ncbi:DUF11 domain-containing protein [Paraclostridium bifermentans]|uniref:DUF11 domain-containing protein n=1 Tax=Paraclostridium bifermentans TaxID=1490 RepID=UPI00359C8EFE